MTCGEQPAGPAFVPGLDLCEAFYHEVVAPILTGVAPSLRYAAGRIGPGSDVAGFDTARSTDHDWGPRLTIWLNEADADRCDDLRRAIGERLPATFRGFATTYDRNDDGTATLRDAGGPGERLHFVDVVTVRHWFGGGDGRDPGAATLVRLPDEAIEAALAGRPPAIDPATWLTLPSQHLLEITAGRVFRDDEGAVTRLREALAWYPDDTWRLLMAATWRRIDQLEPFVGRCGEVGDDLGSQLVAFSQIRDIMRLGFLQERKYAPYPKWFGMGFARLACVGALAPLLDRARWAPTWQEREAALLAAEQWLGARQNGLGIAAPVDPSARTFFNRPFQVLFGSRFAEALVDAIADPRVRSLPWAVGGIDDITDSTDVVGRGDLQRAIAEWMRSAGS